MITCSNPRTYYYTPIFRFVKSFLQFFKNAGFTRSPLGERSGGSVTFKLLLSVGKPTVSFTHTRAEAERQKRNRTERAKRADADTTPPSTTAGNSGGCLRTNHKHNGNFTAQSMYELLRCSRELRSEPEAERACVACERSEYKCVVTASINISTVDVREV